MNKIKLFLENFLVYGLGGIISKIIPLIMVPIITRLMVDSSYYGISDMSNTIVSFASAIALMGMYDAMYRMFFDNEDFENKRGICSTAFIFSITVSFIIFVFMILIRNQLATLFFGDSKYSYLIYITAIATLVGATNNIVSAPTRMQNKRKTYLVMNIVTPVISYLIAIPLLLKGYYVVALPLSGAISAILNEIVFICLNKKWFSFKSIKFEFLKPLLKIGIPLMPNFLIYWIFNSSDKLMITNILTTAETGIYSVGSKLGHASQLIYTAFAGGWQFFAFSTMNEENQVESNSRIFEYLGVISFICSMFVFSLAEPIYKFLFVGDYVKGYIVSPYLFLAPLLQMLFQIEANQFIVVKKTWPNFFILSVGAIVNVILNVVFIPKIGIEGAAIASLIGYVFSVIICSIVLIKMKLMVLRPRFMVVSLLMSMFIIIWRMYLINYTVLSIITNLFISIIFIILYLDDIKKLFLQLKFAKKEGN